MSTDSALGSLIIESIVVGGIATFVADLWSLALQAIGGVPRANWGLIGRWIAGFRRGVFVHHPITAAPPISGELVIGWAFHYVVGVIYAVLYLVVVRTVIGSTPSLLSALVFAWITLIAPWFVMQPALGLGVMAARAPKPRAARILSFSVHTWFGIGLYLGSMVWLAVT